MDITDPNIWYREELQCLLDMVTIEIGRLGARASDNEKAALGALWGKLTRAVELSPGMMRS